LFSNGEGIGKTGPAAVPGNFFCMGAGFIQLYNSNTSLKVGKFTCRNHVVVINQKQANQLYQTVYLHRQQFISTLPALSALYF
jgi:hypothetical protein